MGLISRQIRRSANQKLAEPLTTTTPLSIADAMQAITAACEAQNEASAARYAAEQQRLKNGNRLQRAMADKDGRTPWKDFYLEATDRKLLVGWTRSPDFIRTHRPQWHNGWWLARVEFPGDAPPSQPGPTPVSVTLLVWVTDREKRMASKDEYKAFTDLVLRAIRPDAV